MQHYKYLSACIWKLGCKESGLSRYELSYKQNKIKSSLRASSIQACITSSLLVSIDTQLIGSVVNHTVVAREVVGLIHRVHKSSHHSNADILRCKAQFYFWRAKIFTAQFSSYKRLFKKTLINIKTITTAKIHSQLLNSIQSIYSKFT